MAYHIYPTETPVGTFQSNPTNYMREYQWIQYAHDIKLSHCTSYVISGMAISSYIDPGGAAIKISAGYAINCGRRIETDSDSYVLELPDGLNYIWQTLTFSGALVTGISHSANLTGTPPSFSCCIGTALVTAGVLSTCTDSAKSPVVVAGTYTGDGTTGRLIFLGNTPKRVDVFGNYTNATAAHHVGYYDHGLRFSDHAVTLDGTVAEERPEIVTLGFKVSVSGGGNGLNYTGLGSTDFHYYAHF